MHFALWQFMCWILLPMAGEGDEKKSRAKRLKRTPFLFDTTSKEAVSSFEVYFISSENEGSKCYNYGFTLDKWDRRRMA